MAKRGPAVYLPCVNGIWRITRGRLVKGEVWQTHIDTFIGHNINVRCQSVSHQLNGTCTLWTIQSHTSHWQNTHRIAGKVWAQLWNRVSEQPKGKKHLIELLFFHQHCSATQKRWHLLCTHKEQSTVSMMLTLSKIVKMLSSLQTQTWKLCKTQYSIKFYLYSTKLQQMSSQGT